MTRFYLLIFSILTLSACRELVQSEFPNFSQVPTVNSILVADSVIKLHVSLASKLDTNQLGWVNNATVLLYIDDIYEETLSYKGEGIYTSTSVVESLKTYRCEVSIPTFQTIVCSSSIPFPSELSGVVHSNNAGVNEEGLTYPAITFTFKNNPQRRDYYEAKIKLFKYDQIIYGTPIFLSDPVLLNEGIPIAVFSNELIKADSYTMTINYTTGGAGSSGSGSLKINLYPFVLELRSVSYDYYKYAKQFYLYNKSRYPETIGGVVTPTSLYSNVENGYGIFAGYSTVVSDTIKPNRNGRSFK